MMTLAIGFGIGFVAGAGFIFLFVLGAATMLAPHEISYDKCASEYKTR